MKTRKGIYCFTVFFFAAILLGGCAAGGPREDFPPRYPYPQVEAEWIRKGEPIPFEGKQWYPIDTIESLLDSEVYLMGVSQGVQFFIEKVDVKPYDRLYTKFGQNKFRIYEPKDQ